MNMTEKMLDLLKKRYTLSEVDAGEFARMKVSGMDFTVSAYDAEGLGRVSVMTCQGFFGLMKMDTLMVGPRDVDAPFYSFDYIHAMGKETLVMELYNCVIEGCSMDGLDRFAKDLEGFEDYTPSSQWYEHLLLPQTVRKKGKKKDRPVFDEAALEYFTQYLDSIAQAPACSRSKKNEKISEYCEGLIENGGPAVNTFSKAFGKEKTGAFLRTVLFGTATAG